MSKNRDRRGSGPAPKIPGGSPPEAESEALPGGEDEGVGDAETENVLEKVFEDDLRKNLGDEVADTLLGVDKASGAEKNVVALKTGEKNRLSRAQMHLDWLIQEVTAMANEGALVGVFRKACAECRVVFNDSSAALWGPLKSVSAVLETVRKNGGV